MRCTGIRGRQKTKVSRDGGILQQEAKPPPPKDQPTKVTKIHCAIEVVTSYWPIMIWNVYSKFSSNRSSTGQLIECNGDANAQVKPHTLVAQ